jgi:hypothetical protein
MNAILCNSRTPAKKELKPQSDESMLKAT